MDRGGAGDMLAQERRHRLLGAMANAGIEQIVLYGNAWQGDYLRYATNFGILEGHGLALVSSDGTTELFLDSATEAERAEAEAPENKICVAADISRAVAARLDRAANRRFAAAPRRLLPPRLPGNPPGLFLSDSTPLPDPLLLHT